ncbi:MAG TPA: hypothetical protein DCP31_05405 [Cyanobacteria bacterium UBA8543]|nr:hypothetical protein [Cyanobacteria bacterium UBA8543]
MTSIAISLDKRSYPLMMHLSILPKYGITLEKANYDPTTQTSGFSHAMKGSWCTVSGSTFKMFSENDDDSQEDD